MVRESCDGAHTRPLHKTKGARSGAPPNWFSEERTQVILAGQGVGHPAYKIRVLTNRPIRFGEAWVNGRSTDYNLSALELNITEDKDKRTGILLPASKFRIEKKTNELELENYQNPWKLINIMDRSKE
jgi:hypothetical protein